MSYVAGTTFLSLFGLGLLGVVYLVNRYRNKKGENKT